MIEFTELPGERRFKKIDWLGPLPPCQHHLIAGGPACSSDGEFDTPTKDGPWADLCQAHVELDTYPNIHIGYHRFMVVRQLSTDG